MSAAAGDQNHPILNLTAEEKRIYGTLFAQADREQIGVVTGENAVTFFERTGISSVVLGEIWQIADQENRGLLTKPGFCIVLRLIGHYQAGRVPSAELAFKPAPMPRFEGPPGGPAATGIPTPASPVGQAAFAPSVLQPQLSGTPPIRVPPLDAQKCQQFAGLFERSSTQNGLIDGATAKAIFEKAELPNEMLGRIWNLSDREQKGALDATEFIVAMHLLTSLRLRAMPGLPTTLPQGLYEAAARRGLPPPSRPIAPPGAIPRQLTGNSTGAIPRTQSPLVRSPVSAAVPPPQQVHSAPWLVTPADKVKFDQFFASIDTVGRGTISGEQAVNFFSDSRLPEDTLAQIWDLADINSEGHLNRDEFAVAMYLIRQQRAPNAGPLPAFLPPGLTPPSMRKSQQTSVPQANVPPPPPPAFVDLGASTSDLTRSSAADDLFGLDEPAAERSVAQPALLPVNHTGASASNDPFRTGQLASPGSPQRSQPSALPATTGFKPFMPTSAFGASLAQQTTGGSAMSSQATSLPRGQQQSIAPPAARTADDLLGDSEVQAQESSKFNSDTSELANMSSQIGNLRGQMEQTQTKKSTTQAELATSNAQKNDLEVRLKQFRQQYEHEVRLVKDLESQLTASREISKQLGQELAMLEGSYQDLQTRHQTASQALQTDQRENADLKTRISTLNAEVGRLKAEVEKMKLDARQQKGLVSINKKQITTNENERDRLQSEKEDLASQAKVASEQSRAVATPDTHSGPTSAPPLASPAESLSVTNPFARKPGQENGHERASSPFTPLGVGSASAPSAFDTLFGPSSMVADAGQARTGMGSPPVTSFGRSASSTTDEGAFPEPKRSEPDAGEPIPPVTPPSTDRVKELQHTIDASSPPPPPEGRQFTASELPIINLERKENDSETRSTLVRPPASRAGEPDESPEALSALFGSGVGAADMPGAFPAVPGSAVSTSQPKTQATQDDFDAAFADFEADQRPRAGDTGAGPSSSHNASGTNGSAVEFPPIQSLEHDDEDDESDDDSDDDDEKAHTGFEDDFTAIPSQGPPAAAQSRTLPAANAIAIPAVEGPPTPLPKASAQPSPPTYEESHLPSHGGSGSAGRPNQVPPEFNGLLPSREDPTVGTLSAVRGPNEGASAGHRDIAEVDRNIASVSDLGRPLFPPSRANTNDVFHDASSRPISSVADTRAIPDIDQASTNTDILDEFDDFADLAEAKEADKSGNNDIDFGFDRAETAEFNPVFDSPAASMTNTVVSSQQTPIAPSRSLSAQGPPAGGLQSSKSAVRALDYTTNGGGDERGSQGTSQHDWDSIFAGLDNSKAADTPSDPWSSAGLAASSVTPSASQAKLPHGSAVTPGTEHDDPILKRLTGMGYPRKAALDALEKYDYDINRAVDHLAG